jgi:hypothetical protein
MVEEGARRRRKKRWSELSPEARAAIVAGGVAEVIITAVALGDLRRRPSARVRGWKPLWALGFVVQPFGPLLYLWVGRRRADP